jgi:hypothetical protein
MCRIKQKKRNIGIYDYAHIALWDSSFRPTAIKLVAMLIINGIYSNLFDYFCEFLTEKYKSNIYVQNTYLRRTPH